MCIHIVIIIIHECIYTPTGKREDLWESQCKETQSV